MIMLKSERESIRRNFVSLVEELPCDKVASYLYQDGVISNNMLCEILEFQPTQRSYHLLILLQRRGPRAFQSFIRALKYANREDLAASLISFENSFSQLSIWHKNN